MIVTIRTAVVDDMFALLDILTARGLVEVCAFDSNVERRNFLEIDHLFRVRLEREKFY